MADIKISALPAATALDGSELVPIVQAGVTSQSTVKDVSAVLKIKVSLSSAQILALNSVPITIVPAQGANTMIVPVRVVINKHYNSVTYTTNINLVLGAGTVFASTFSNALGFTADEIAGYTITANASASPPSGSINVDLKISASVGNPAAGNSTIDIHLLYTVINL